MELPTIARIDSARVKTWHFFEHAVIVLRTSTKGTAMATYRMVYGEGEQVVTETYENVEVEREDGWVTLFRGDDAILRVREEHVQSLDEVS
jgi:hypothetical protein